jgi:hypothetical protein
MLKALFGYQHFEFVDRALLVFLFYVFMSEHLLVKQPSVGHGLEV